MLDLLAEMTACIFRALFVEYAFAFQWYRVTNAAVAVWYIASLAQATACREAHVCLLANLIFSLLKPMTYLHFLIPHAIRRQIANLATTSVRQTTHRNAALTLDIAATGIAEVRLTTAFTVHIHL